VRKPLIALLSAALILMLATAALALDVPSFKGRVNDYGDMI